VEATESGAEELTLDREYIVLSVEDRGVGRDEDKQGRVFEPFFTTKDLGSRAAPGSQSSRRSSAASESSQSTRARPRTGAGPSRPP